MRSTPRARKTSCASASGSVRGSGSPAATASATTASAISVMYSPPYPSSGASWPRERASSERAKRSIWAPWSLK
ncbi:Uncharacterised protein [Mycobacteroides abscessus]|nr:Uncharacterised protein [Mycobacteroides abscessus]